MGFLTYLHTVATQHNPFWFYILNKTFYFLVGRYVWFSRCGTAIFMRDGWNGLRDGKKVIWSPNSKMINFTIQNIIYILIWHSESFKLASFLNRRRRKFLKNNPCKHVIQEWHTSFLNRLRLFFLKNRPCKRMRMVLTAHDHF